MEEELMSIGEVVVMIILTILTVIFGMWYCSQEDLPPY